MDRIYPSRPKHSGRGSRDSILHTRAVGKLLPGPHAVGRGQGEGQVITPEHPEAAWGPWGEAEPGSQEPRKAFASGSCTLLPPQLS